MSALSSKLKSLLPDLIAGRCVELNGLIVFGVDSFDELMDRLLISTQDEENNGERNEVLEKSIKLVEDVTDIQAVNH